MSKILTDNKFTNFFPILMVLIAFLLFGSQGFMAGDVYAAGPPLSINESTADADKITAGTTDGNKGVNKVIATAVTAAKTVAGLVVAVSVLVIVWAGFKYATSQGDPKTAEGAKAQIIGAGIGMGISFMAVVLVQIFSSVFGIS